MTGERLTGNSAGAQDDNASAIRLLPSQCRDTFETVDWAATALGPVGQWPSALRTAVQLCLNSQFPMTLVWGPDLTVMYNDGYVPIMGANHPAAYGLPSREAYAEVWDNNLAAKSEQVLRGEVVWEEDLLIAFNRDGVTREAYFTFCYSPVLGDDGDIEGALSIATETSATVIGQRRSAQLSKLSADLLDVQRLEDISPAFERAAQLNPLDCHRWVLLEMDASERVIRATGSNEEELTELVARQQPVDLQAVLAETSLKTGWHGASDLSRMLVFAVEPQALVDPDAGYLAFLVRLQRMLDTTCLKLARSKQAVDERAKLYSLLFEHSADAMLLTSPNGAVHAANPAACKLFGWSEDELIGLRRERLVDMRSPAVLAALEERARTGYFNGNLEIRSVAGPVLCEITSVLFPFEGDDERAMLVLRSVEERQREEEERRNSARLEAIGQLTGGVSHDFNNLLQVIIGGAGELITLLQNHPEALGYANMTHAAALQASDLTQQLLAFSRRQTLTPRAIKLSKLISDMDQILDRALGEPINVTLDLRDDATVLLDVAQAQSAILNVAINAKDAMPEGGDLLIRSEAACLSDERARALGCEAGDYISVSVADTGVGIPEADIKRVIEPFFTTKSEKSGTGLGLSMVFGFVQQSGGGLEIVSTVGQGTTVTLFFPVSHQPVPKDLPANAAVSAGSGEKVVVVEDNAMVASMLTKILEMYHFSVQHFASGEDLVAYLEEDHQVDFLISDIVLGGGMDGWQVIETVRKMRPGLKMALMSGYPGEHRDDSQQLSVPLLAKPFRAHDVIALLNKLAEG